MEIKLIYNCFGVSVCNFYPKVLKKTKEISGGEIIFPLFYLFLNCFSFSNNVIYTILNPKKFKKIERNTSKKKSLKFFLRYLIKIFTDLSKEFSIFYGFNKIFNQFNKFFYIFFFNLEKFFQMEEESFKSENNPIIKKNLKKSKSKSLNRNLECLEKFSGISGKKNFLLAFDLKQINHFISGSLGKLTSNLSLNISQHLEYIEQISDHSIGTEKNLVKIKTRLKFIKNVKKNKILCSEKAIVLAIFSFFLIKLLF
jgi:hypothetical protein